MKKANEDKIQFVADECVSDKTIKFLQLLGYKVESVWDLNLRGASNGTLLNRAIKDNKVFITKDLDFCNIILYPPSLHHGVIVLKTSPETEDAVRTILKDLLLKLNPTEYDKTLIVVDHNKYRMRKD